MNIASKLNPSKFKLKIGSVRNKLVLSFLLILLLPSLAIGTFGYITAKDKVDEQLESMATTDIALVSDLVDQYIQEKISDVNQLSRQLSNMPASELLDAYAQSHSEAESVTAVMDDGASFYSTSSVQTASDFMESDVYAQAMNSKGEVVLTEPYTSEDSGDTVVALAKASDDGRSFVSVVLDLTGLSDIVGGVRIGENGFIVIFSSSGANIVSPPWGVGGTGQQGGDVPAEGAEAPPADGSGGQQVLFDGDSGEIDQVSPEGDSRHLIYITNELTGWKIAGDRSPSEVTNAASPILNNTLIVIVIFTVIGAGLIHLIIRSITRPLKALTEASQVISEGDLSRRADVKAKDEFGELGAAFNRMVDSLRSVVSEVADSSNQLTASSQELSASAGQTATAADHIVAAIERMADGAARQANRVEDSSRTIHEVSDRIGQIVGSAHTAADTTRQVAARSAEGGEAIRNAVRQMSSISGSVDGLAEVIDRLVATSLEIGQTIGVISDLSQQTNILALNAAIEAARAGEEGQGFGVVAGEVKKLAEQSAKSAKQVASLNSAIRAEIANVQVSMRSAMDEVNEGIEVVETAGRLFTEIEASVDEVRCQVQGVTHSAEEIAKGTALVVKAIEDISKVSQQAAAGAQTVSASTQQQLASMEQISSSSSSLSQMAVQLQGLVDRFKL
ncbi:methyl-accepting chemotaxis protein [Cohnella thailandensis]|uniref:Methyl-accepting chemotaxis protein n=1 Tax=Cohnella thailandensis TaxID=557557 RepID=A0A841SPC9_9BACL|nr:methyl-accepting chemotaxis protein [Cohnella thailandensis]MBB6633052.1 methyl-accepting chemotaxis protein [Cohnella thailandensis]MBP1975253.1 methyl-accepting chemotaxis protein [Cohnella thailandensis]